MSRTSLAAAVAASVLISASAWAQTTGADMSHLSTFQLTIMLHDAMELGSGGMFDAIEREFPDEFKAFEDNFIAEIHAGHVDAGAAKSIGYTFAKGLFDKYGPAMAHAPVEDQLRQLYVELALLKALKATGGRGDFTCDQFVQTNAVQVRVLVPDDPPVQTALTDLSAGRVTLMGAGTRTPVDYVPLTAAEIRILTREYKARHGKERDLAFVGRPELGHGYGNGALCQAGITLLETLAAGQPERAARYMAAAPAA